MSWIDDYIKRLKARGVEVVQTSGFRNRSNGSAWAKGQPVGQMAHHLVISTQPGKEDDGENLVLNGHSGLSGPLANEYVAYDGTLYLISAGPANHAGRGVREVLDRVQSNQAPFGDAARFYAQDDSPNFNGKPKFYGNQWYWGRELQHPGDNTPYSDAIIRTLVQANAALAEVMGWPAARSIHHKEHSPRKIDLSWTGDLRAEVSKALTGTSTNTATTTIEEIEMVICHATTAGGNHVYGQLLFDGIHFIRDADVLNLMKKAGAHQMEVTRAQWNAAKASGTGSI